MIEKIPNSDLTHRNHFKFGFNGVPFSIRNSEADEWFVSYGKISRQPLSFRDECIETVKLLRSKTDKTLYVLYSGGVDSEVVLNAFIAAKIDNWKILSINYNGKNRYDLDQIEKYINYRGLRHLHSYFDVRLLDYWCDSVISDMIKYGSVSPQFPVHIVAMLHVAVALNGFPVVGSAECYFEKSNDTIVMFEREKVASLYRGLYLNGAAGAAGFFQYTPEIMASWIRDSEFQRLIVNNPNFSESLSLKREIYSKHFDIPLREKQTGFELFKELDTIKRSEMSAYPAAAQDSIIKTPLLELCSQLGI